MNKKKLEKADGFVISRHTRESGYPVPKAFGIEKSGFPINNFGNDSLKKDFLRVHQSSVKKTYILDTLTIRGSIVFYDL